MNTYILFGRQLFQDGKLDWIAEARCNLAINLIKNNPESLLIISGGKTTKSESEASVMKEYIIERAHVEENILVEESGLSTIHQLVVLKNDFLVPKKLFDVGLISDEIHMPRIKLTATHLLGEKFTITAFEAEVRISGQYRKAIENSEKELYDLTSRNPVILHYPKGDDNAWRLYDEYYRNKKDELKSSKLDVNKEVLEYIESKRI